jgi:hypothetical protein
MQTRPENDATTPAADDRTLGVRLRGSIVVILHGNVGLLYP